MRSVLFKVLAGSTVAVLVLCSGCSDGNARYVVKPLMLPGQMAPAYIITDNRKEKCFVYLPDGQTDGNRLVMSFDLDDVGEEILPMAIYKKETED